MPVYKNKDNGTCVLWYCKICVPFAGRFFRRTLYNATSRSKKEQNRHAG